MRCRVVKGRSGVGMRSALHVLGFLLIAGLLVVPSIQTAEAVPACSEPVPFVQPNGAVVEIVLNGDEFLSWTEDISGNLIVFDAAWGGYRYAIWTDDGPQSTGVALGAVVPPKTPLIQVDGRDIPQAVLDHAAALREEQTPTTIFEPMSIQPMAVTTTPVVSSAASLRRPTLVVSVRWEDESNIAAVPLTATQIHDIVFNTATNSANKYFRELATAQEDIIVPATVPQPFDGRQGIIEVTLPGSHTNPGNSPSGRRSLVFAALEMAAENELVNFASYDANGNLKLEAEELAILLIIHGYSASHGGPAPNIWPCAFLSMMPKIDGVSLTSCAITSSYSSSQFRYGELGTICHEMGHATYDFLDTYDYGTKISDGRSQGHGNWSLMSAGANGHKAGENSGTSPAYVDAYNLVRSKFVTPGVISETTSNVRLNSHLDIYKVTNTVNTKQYFLVQQRKFGAVGNFDQGAFYRIGGASANSTTGGVLISHVDETVQSGNDKNSHYLTAIEEAHGGVQNLQTMYGSYGGLNDLWGTDYHTFGEKTSPSTALYQPYQPNTQPAVQNIQSGVSIRSIQWDGASASTLDVAYGMSLCEIEAFTLSESIGIPKLDQKEHTIQLIVPYGTDLTSLVPEIQIVGASVSPASGEVVDFTNPVAYTVTAQDNSTQEYVVTVSIDPDFDETANDIVRFSIPGAVGAVVFDHENRTIHVAMPVGTDLTYLIPDIRINGASITPASGEAMDFTAPVVYTVTAEDGGAMDYTVSVSIGIVSDGVDFSALYQPVEGGESNALDRYVYFGHYDDEGTARPRLWYVIGREDGALVLFQQSTYPQEQRIMNPGSYDAWEDSQMYRYLNEDSELPSETFLHFYLAGEIAAIRGTTVHNWNFYAAESLWKYQKGTRGNTLFYLPCTNNTTGLNLPYGMEITWSATLEDYKDKLIELSRVTSFTWLRSRRFNPPHSFTYDAWPRNIVGGTFVWTSYTAEGNKSDWLPLCQLNPADIIFFTEIGTDMPGAPLADENYAAGEEGAKNFKLTVLGGSNGADVGTLSGVPQDGVRATGDTLTLEGLSASVSGVEYSLRYKVVEAFGSQRELVGYGISSDLTSIDIDTSGFTGIEDYTIYVWIEKENSVQSNEASMPQGFRLLGPPSATELLMEDLEALTWDVIRGDNTTQDNVTTDLALPIEGENGSFIAWSSDPAGVISDAGVVTRPALGADNCVVTLTATAHIGEISSEAEFVLTVTAVSPLIPVDQSTLTVTPMGTITYGDTPIQLETEGGSGSGAVTFELASGDAVTVTPSGLVTVARAGTATITATKAGDDDYLPTTSAPLTITVNPAPLTVTAEDRSITYGDTPPTYAVTYSAFAYDEDDSALGGTLKFQCDYTQWNNAYEYPITPSGLNADNYNITFVPGTLTVAPKTTGLTIEPIFPVTYAGLAHEPAPIVKDGVNVLTVTTDYAVTYSNNTAAGTATVTIAGAGNYTGASAEQTFAINKAPLTVTAEDRAITYGDTPPTYAVAYSAFAYDEYDSALGGTLKFQCDYTQWDNADDYPITPSGLTADNYNITFVPGTLTVAPKTVASGITIDTILPQTHTGVQIMPIPAVAFGAITLVEHTDFTYSYGTNILPGAGAGSVTIHGMGNYTGTETIYFDITHTTLTAGDFAVSGDSKTYNGTPQSATVHYSGGITVTEAGAISVTFSDNPMNVGTYDILITTAGGTVYEAITAPLHVGVLTITKAPGLTASSPTIHVKVSAPEAEATYSLATHLLPSSPFGEAGAVSYILDALSGDETMFSAPPSLNGDALTYTPAAAKTAGQTAVQTVTISTAHFMDVIVTITFEVTAKDAVGISGVAVDGKPYDGTPVAPDLDGLAITGEADLTATLAPELIYTYTGDGYESSTPPANAGSYQLVLSVETADYIGASEPISFTISQKSLTVTAENRTVTYGDAPPSYTATYGDFVDGEDEADLDGILALDCDYTQWDDVDDYAITPSGLMAGNYNITFVPGTLTVNPNAASLTIDPISAVTYTGAAHEPAPVMKSGATVLTAGSDYTVSYSANINAGTATMTATGTGNYLGAMGQQTFTIAKATPTYTVPTDLTAAYGDTLADVELPDGFAWEAADTTPVGEVGTQTHLATFAPADTDNYCIVQQIAIPIEVTEAEPPDLEPIDIADAIIAPIPAVTYTRAAHTPTVIVTYEGEALALDGDYTVSYRANTNAGTATVTISGAGDYLGTQTAEFTIAPKPLVVTANNASMPQNTALPTFGYTVSGLIVADTITTPPQFTCATNGTVAGDFAIVPHGADAGGNYVISYQNGTLTVTSAPVSPPTGGPGPSLPPVTPPLEPETPAAPMFVDVPDTHWAASSILTVAEHGLFQGISDTVFDPGGTMTRAMFATALARLDGAELDDMTASSNFTDVPDGQWYTAPIAWAAEHGIVSGTGNDNFLPEAPVTREQIAVMLYHYIRQMGYDLTQTPAAPFADAEQISDWASDAVAFMQSTGLLTGKESNRFDPQGVATRAEVAVIFDRLMARLLTES